MASTPPTQSLPSRVAAALRHTTSSSDQHASRAIRVALQLEARDLPNLDTRGKSDPFAIIYRKSNASTPITEKWDKIGQTETVYNNLNPKWSTTFTLEYRFGTTTDLRFSVYDRDCKDEDLSKHDYIGEVRCTVAQVVLADKQRLVSQINNKNAKPGTRTGTLTIRAEEQQGDLGDNLTLQFAVTGLRRARKPFYVLNRKNRNDDDFSPVVYSEVHKAYAGANHVTTFKPITTSLARLLNGDMDRELEVQFMNYDRSGSHYRGGSVRFTFRAAKAAVANASSPRFALRKKRSNGHVVDAGQLIINKCQISAPFSFEDYVRKGVEINTMIAVDMSNTNGNPADPRSLQYKNGENEYMIALREVGSVLAPYSTIQKFPAFGFGATQPPLYDETAHCFPLNSFNDREMCDGIKGVVDGYMKALHTVGPFEPCRYGPVLKHVMELTRAANAKHGAVSYTILLLFTDGDFEDLADVANLICDGAELPLSIVIVGIGNSRFVKLERLDGDDERLCSTQGIRCSRDIVQFVQFHKHRYNPTQLTREVLDEIPEQLVSYMRSKGLKPSDIKPLRRTRLSAPPTENAPYLPESVLQSIPSSSAPELPPKVNHLPEYASSPCPGQPAVSVQHSAPFIPSVTAGQPVVSIQNPAPFTPAVTVSMTGGTTPTSSSFHQAPGQLHSGMSSQANDHRLNATPSSGAQGIPSSPSLSQPTAPTQTAQSALSAQTSIPPHGFLHQNPHNPPSHLQAFTPYGLTQYPPSQYPGSYGDQVHLHQPPSFPQQHHSQYPPHTQQQHQQPLQYNQPQPHHPHERIRPQNHPHQAYPYLYANEPYGSTYSQAPHCDLSATYSSYSTSAGQNYQYPQTSMPFPSAEPPFPNQYARPNYPTQ